MHFGDDATTLAAKRVFGIGDPILLSAARTTSPRRPEVPLEALDLALFNWGQPSRGQGDDGLRRGARRGHPLPGRRRAGAVADVRGGMTTEQRFARARPRLLRLAYAELGDFGEAEDVVQEAWLRLERTDAQSIDDLDAWLTHGRRPARARHAALRPPRREAYVGPWLPEPIVSSRADDPADRITLDESVSYALLALLEQLTPAERTAFVLHDVFDVPFGEVAQVVGRTPEAVRQLASRARRHIAEQRPRFEASREEHDRAVRAFAEAVGDGDFEGLVAVLDPDVVWTSDGGGRAVASRRPQYGAPRVARGWVALRRAGRIEPAADAGRDQRPARPADRGDRWRPLGALVRGRRRPHRPDRRRAQPGEAGPRRIGPTRGRPARSRGRRR